MTETINQYDSQGRLHGVWELYWSDGTLWWRENWLHGKPHGLSEWCYSNDTLDKKRYYLNIK